MANLDVLRKGDVILSLMEAKLNTEHIIIDVNTQDAELNTFLFSLGCYSGEPITVISRHKSNLIVLVKDGRYSFDRALASAVTVG